jgi:hypothetical protein
MIVVCNDRIAAIFFALFRAACRNVEAITVLCAKREKSKVIRCRPDGGGG